jgi:hypothetical protein
VVPLVKNRSTRCGDGVRRKRPSGLMTPVYSCMKSGGETGHEADRTSSAFGGRWHVMRPRTAVRPRAIAREKSFSVVDSGFYHRRSNRDRRRDFRRPYVLARPRYRRIDGYDHRFVRCGHLLLPTVTQNSVCVGRARPSMPGPPTETLRLVLSCRRSGRLDCAKGFGAGLTCDIRPTDSETGEDETGSEVTERRRQLVADPPVA